MCGAIVREQRASLRRAQRRRGLSFVRLLLLLLLLVAAGYALIVWQVYRVAAEENAQAADVIVVLGAAQWNGQPSPVLQARLDHALALYNTGLAQAIITTGGLGDGDRYTEADIAARYLTHRGVPVEEIAREEEGRNTWQSLSAVSGIMREHGWHSAILVSDPFHMMRSAKMAGDLGITAYTSPTRTSPISADQGWEAHYALREAASYIAYLFSIKN